MEQLVSRKFIFAIIVIVIGFVFVLTNRLSADSWMTFASVIGGIYVLGNVAEKVTDKIQ